jgi:hypothetical protein
MSEHEIIHADCLEHMREMPTDSVDLVFTSPPYEDARTYGVGFRLKGEAWVEWAADRYMECLRVSRGLVAWVVEGRTRRTEYSATPLLLAVELQRRGAILRKPPIYARHSVPGSGGKDWLRNDYEFIVCATRERGRLPWSDNTAMGKPPKWQPGGAMTHQMKNGRKVARKHTKTMPDGSKIMQGYNPPKISNPGNVIWCKVGGGRMGHPLAHENEAPFPLDLAEFFVRSFCPPDGTVLDPFGGSGTTAHAALIHGRRSISIDIRESQCDLARRRMAATTVA